MNNTILYVFLSFSVSFVFVLIYLPSIAEVAKGKNLLKTTDRLSGEKRDIYMGGVAIFVAVIFGTIIGTMSKDFDDIKYVIASLILIFFVGLKNDVISIPAWKKLIVQFIAAFIVVVFGNIRIEDLLFINVDQELNIFISYLISIGLIMFSINSFIFLNGIKGINTSLGIIGGITFGTWFCINGKVSSAALAISLFGSLLAHMLWLAKNKTKVVQLGETGAKLIGFLIVILAIKINQFGLSEDSIGYTPLMVYATFFIPLSDGLRVIIQRMIKGGSMFTRDTSHIHFRLRQRGYGNKAIVIYFTFSTVLLIVLSFFMNEMGVKILYQYIVITLVITLFFVIAFMKKKTSGIR